MQGLVSYLVFMVIVLLTGVGATLPMQWVASKHTPAHDRCAC